MSTPKPFSTWRPLLWLSLAFMAGILVASRVRAGVTVWLALGGVALLLALLARLLLPRLGFDLLRLSPAILFLAALSLAFFYLGAARYQASLPKVDAFHIAWYTDRQYEMVVTGTLTAPPDVRDTYTNLRLEATQVDTGGGDLPVHGLLLVRVQPGESWHYGDVVRVRGLLQTPPTDELFSYRDYLARQGILAYMPSAKATRLPFTSGNPILRLVYAFKDRAIANLYRIFPDPEASLLSGILLGDANGLPASLQQAYQNTGTSHIIAISGFNISIIAGLFVLLFSRLLGSRRGAVAAVIGIALYTLLVGATPSVLRAAIMGSLGILAAQLGRRQDGLNSLAATAGVMALLTPSVLWDAGFQLSFAATLGLILYAEPLQGWVTGLFARRLSPVTARRLGLLVGGLLLFTLAAQVTTLPVMAWHFQRISLVALLANPFILPAQPAVMVLGGLALFLSFIYLPLGKLAAWLAWPFAAYTDRAVEFFNRLPHGYIVLGEFSLLFVFLYYGVLLFLTFGGPRVKRAVSPAMAPAVILTTLGVFVFLVWSAVFTIPDGRLHLVFLDAGSADAILIRTPAGRSLLINGGASPAHLSAALSRRLSPFDRSLDWLIVASTGDGQLDALPTVLQRIPAAQVLWAGPVGGSSGAAGLDRYLSGNSLPVTRASPGLVLDLGSGARLEVRSVSARGATLLVEWAGFRVLLPVGMNFATLDELNGGKTIGPLTALLLADSGLAATNPPGWLASLQPQVAVLSVASGDPNNLPSASVVSSLPASTTLLRTDRNGWIDLSTDGSHLWVEVEKK